MFEDWIWGVWFFCIATWIFSKYMIARNNRLAEDAKEQRRQQSRFQSGASYGIWMQYSNRIRRNKRGQRQQQAAEGGE